MVPVQLAQVPVFEACICSLRLQVIRVFRVFRVEGLGLRVQGFGVRRSGVCSVWFWPL